MNKLPPKLKNGKSMKNSFTLTELPVIITTVAIMAAAFLLTGCGKKPATPPPAVQSTPAQSTPAQATPAQSTPAQATPAQATPAQATPAQATPAPSSVTGVNSPNLPVVVTNNAVLYTPGAPWNPMLINGRVRGWYFQHGRFPKNFEEFVATSGLQVPPPPPGMKYEFDRRLHVKVVKAK